MVPRTENVLLLISITLICGPSPVKASGSVSGGTIAAIVVPIAVLVVVLILFFCMRSQQNAAIAEEAMIESGMPPGAAGGLSRAGGGFSGRIPRNYLRESAMSGYGQAYGGMGASMGAGAGMNPNYSSLGQQGIGGYSSGGLYGSYPPGYAVQQPSASYGAGMPGYASYNRMGSGIPY